MESNNSKNNRIELEDEIGGFLITPEDVILNLELSNTAFRIYSYLRFRCSIRDWKFWNSDIMNNCGIKDSHTLSKYMKELESFNYIRRMKNRDEDGKMSGGYKYIILSKVHRVVKVSQSGCGENECSEKQVVKNIDRVVKVSQYGKNHKHNYINLNNKKDIINKKNPENEKLGNDETENESLKSQKEKEKKKSAAKRKKEKFIYRTIDEAKELYDGYIKTDPGNVMYRKFVNFMFGIDNSVTIEPLEHALKFEKGITPQGLNNLLELANDKELIKDKIIALNDKKDMYVMNRTDLYLTIRNWVKMANEKRVDDGASYRDEINKLIKR